MILDFAVLEPAVVLSVEQTGDPYKAVEIAITTLADPYHIFLLVLGTLLGLLLGVLPGLGGPIGIALLIPITFRLSPNVAIMIMASMLGATAFSGSITAILLNTPGDAPNAATLLDGYPMARDGRAGEALAASATASAGGAIVGVILMLITIPVIREIALLFGSPEVFWLAAIGLAAIAVAMRGSFVANMIAGAFGLMLAFHGLNPVTGTARFTWGTSYLLEGFPLIPVIIGLFAVAEMIKLVGEQSTIAKAERVAGGIRRGVRSVVTNRGTFLRSSMLGWFIGVIPGAGGTVANFLAYMQAKQSAGNPSSFGKGDVRGVIASEASNDAKDGGAMVPTLGLGIPGSASWAILLGAFVIHGVTPGPLLFQENLQLVFIILLSLLFSNILTSLLGLAMANHLARLTEIRITTIAPIILSIAFIGSYAIRSTFTDVIIAFLFGLLGFVMIKFSISRVVIIIALILGPLAERNFHRSLQITRGDYSVFTASIPSKVLIISLALIIAIPLYQKIKAVQRSEAS